MGRKLVLCLWSLLCIVSLVSSKAVISCTDGQNCKHLRIITTNSNEIAVEIRANKYYSTQSINLYGNLMESFSGYDVSSASQLKALNLSYNLLKSNSLRDMSHLQVEEIDLTYNQLTYFSVPRSVKKLVAVRNKLSDVTFEGNSIQELDLSKNQLDKIPGISNQYNLIKLDLSCNEIHEVDFSAFVNLQKLKYLTLANNRIFRTTGKIVLSSLHSLDLSHNILTIFDESLESALKVQELNLRDNQIVMVTAKQRFSNMRSIDLSENDLDCKSLTDFLPKHQNLRSTPDTSCAYGSIQPSGLCCSTSSAPYADRVIRYNKRNYEALQNSSTIQKQSVNCANYKPSPCDGDDNEVYRVANAAASDTQSLISANTAHLEGVLDGQRNVLRKKEEEKRKLDEETSELQSSLDGLLGHIQNVYQEEGLRGASNPVQQLQQIFKSRDDANKVVNNQITEEERKLQNLLQDIAKNEVDLQDLKDKKDRLQADINARNTTVREHEVKIADLKKKLGRD